MPRSDTLLGGRPDTPVTSYRLLPSGRTGLITAGVLIVAAMAWLITVHQSRSMTGMTNGLGQVGQRMPNDMGLLGVLAMWPPMMTAMMAPR